MVESVGIKFERRIIMGFVSNVLDKVDDCAELYNFLFVDYKIDQIDREMDY